MIPQKDIPRNNPPARVLLGSDGSPSPYANTRYYSTDGEILIIRNGNTARMSRETALSDLRGRLARLQAYVDADQCREQMMSAIEQAIEALEALG